MARNNRETAQLPEDWHWTDTYRERDELSDINTQLSQAEWTVGTCLNCS